MRRVFLCASPRGTPEEDGVSGVWTSTSSTFGPLWWFIPGSSRVTFGVKVFPRRFILCFGDLSLVHEVCSSGLFWYRSDGGCCPFEPEAQGAYRSHAPSSGSVEHVELVSPGTAVTVCVSLVGGLLFRPLLEVVGSVESRVGTLFPVTYFPFWLFDLK